ncbi:MAG TPA: flagellar filament capping protein FliD [Fimbriimonadaceae bacterium]|nr:flagellar filament capping protein FliD [Fimbriimonadaceae bacterium]
MSIGSNLAGISFSGIGSGIDTESIISRLMQLEALPIRRLQQQQAQITQQLGVFGAFRGRVSALSSAANSLNSASAYNPSKASSSATDVATITASSGAVAGIYDLKVYQLAQSEKVSSTAQSGVGSALNMTGTFSVNGKSISVVAGDTLTTIAQKVNSAGAGITASIIDGGTDRGYLTFAANDLGAKNVIRMSDTSGSVLGSLGLSSTSLRTPISGGAASYGLSSSTAKFKDVLSFGDFTPMNVTINGAPIAVTADDTLETLKTKIDGAGLDVTATIVTVTQNGEQVKRLEVTGATTNFGTEGDFWLRLGVLKRSNELVAAQDAKFQIDGVAMSSSSNTVTTVIPNVTVNLLKANGTTPERSTLSISRDTEQTKKTIKTFVEAYNAMADFLEQNSGFDKATFEAGPLFGNSIVDQVESTFDGLLFGNVAGVGGAFANLTQLGIGVDEKGKLTVDDTLLDQAIAGDPDSVGALMRSIGTTTSNDLVFVSADAKTLASPLAGYDVVITQLATKGVFTASTEQTLSTTGGEVLTFSGSLIGSTSYQLSIGAGLSQSQVRDLINNDSKLKDLVSAEIVSGKLEVKSKRFGVNGGFDVVSNLDAASNNSGIGKDANKGTYVAGVDIAGTINGEAATGNGQFLTAKSSGTNKNADGLQLQYTGNSLGSVGQVKFVKGVAAKAIESASIFLDTVGGIFTANDQALQAQFDDLSANIDTLQLRLEAKQQELKQKFAIMDRTISQLQAQQSRLGAILRS